MLPSPSEFTADFADEGWKCSDQTESFQEKHLSAGATFRGFGAFAGSPSPQSRWFTLFRWSSAPVLWSFSAFSLPGVFRTGQHKACNRAQEGGALLRVLS